MKHSLLLITFKALALHSLDTLSDIRIKAFNASLLIKTLSIPNPSLLCLVLLSVVNNFQLIISFSFNYLVIVCVAVEPSVINLT